MNLTLLVLWLLTADGGTARAPAAKPAVSAVEHVQGFYAWYLPRVEQERGFPFRPADSKDLSRFLTRRFLSTYRKLAKKAEADPFLCAQDTYEEWSGALSVSPLQEGGDHATLVVTFGPPPSPAHQVQVQVRKVGGQWRIDAAKLHEPAAPKRAP